MVRTTLTKALFAGLALGASSLATAADDPALMTGASTSMLAQTCNGCHGFDGASNGPAIPTIGGISEFYMNELMQGFKSGEVKSTIMGRIAKGYTDEEIEQMSKYFANQPFVVAKQEFDEGQVKEGAKLHDKYCEKCHADGGTSKEDDSGILAGQWTLYLDWAMDDFRAGDREMPKKMKKKVDKLVSKEGDAGLQALYNYYASQQ
jgi:sulfide dehydrogenase cytochrome subunit